VKSIESKNPQQNRDIKIGVKLIESLQTERASHIACPFKANYPLCSAWTSDQSRNSPPTVIRLNFNQEIVIDRDRGR
jgi:hypothetical protein